ncbi:hypothetical protein ACFOYU_18720 [Microvirga sp. GCM10011540]|uniref:hypothetical protein n=1 Tax=Microvirga sp. GCM10011540 TaxID=3317338 RepID=UPI0036107473
MFLNRLHVLALATALSVGGAAGGALAQAGAAPGASPSVDTGAAGTGKFPVRERAGPNATGAVGSPAVNPPGNPPGTIDPTPEAAVEAGATGKSPCLPTGGKNPNSVNPSGMPSRC